MRIGYEVAQQRPLGTDGENHSDLQVPQGKSSLESLSPREFSRNSLTGFTEPGFSRLLGKAILGLKAHQSCEPIPSRFTGPNVMCNRSDGGNGEVDAGVEDKDGGSAVYEQEEPLDFSSKGRQRHSEATLDLRTNGAASPTGSTPCPSLSSPKMPLFSAPSKDRPVETDLSTKEIVRSKIELRLAELRNSGYGAPNKGHPHPFGHDVSATSPPPPQPPPWANFRKGDDRERLLLLDKVRSPDRLDELGHVTRMVARARQTGQVPELLRLKNCLAGSERSLVDDDLPLGNGVNVINSFNMMAMNGFGSHHGQHLTNVPMSLLSPSSATTAAPSRQQTQLQPLVCSDGDNGLGSSSLKLNRPFKNYHSRDAALPLGYCGLSVPFLSAAATDDLLVSGQGLCATDSLGNGSYEEFKRQIRQLQQQQHHQLQHKRPSAAFNGVGHLPLSMSHLIHPRATLPQQHRFVQCEGGERRPDSGCLTTTVLLERRTAADRDAPASPLCRAAPNSSSSTLSSCSPPSPTAAALLNATSAVSALSGGVGGGLMEERPPSRSVAEHPCVSPPSSSSDSVAAMAVATNRANLSPVHPPQSADSNGSNHGNSNSSNGALHLAASKKRGRSLPDELKDEAYWERRRKNNEAAKRSRDARRAKEDEIAIRAAFLEQENLKLRVEVAALKSETAKLRCLLYNS